MNLIYRHYLVSGRVQGVGFRRFTEREAKTRGLRGATRNLRDGRVEILACGPSNSLDLFETAISRGPTGSSVSQIEKREISADAWPLQSEVDFIVQRDGEAPWL
jgi:acylphosphatase